MLRWSSAEDDRVPDSGPSSSVVRGLDHPVISSKDAIKLLPMSETFDFDRGLLLAVQAVQVKFSLSVYSAWFTCGRMWYLRGCIALMISIF